MKRSVANIEGGLNAYRDQYGRWPADLSTLKNYAAQRGRKLDLSPFAELTISRRTSHTVLVEFVTQPPESKRGGFAISKFDVN